MQSLQKINNAPGTEASDVCAFMLLKRTSYTHVFFLSLLTPLLLCGCKRTQSGDFAAFFVQEVAAYGGYTPATNAPVKLSARWTIQSDTNGFQIHLIGTRFAEVESLLNQTCGPHCPQHAVSNVLDTVLDELCTVLRTDYSRRRSRFRLLNRLAVDSHVVTLKVDGD